MSKITLRAARVNAGLSQSEVAEMIGVNPKTISNNEADSSRIKIDLLKKLLSIYNVKNIDDIFLGKDNGLNRE